MREEQQPENVLETDLVERYLQRRLTEAEEAAFEEYLLAHPEAALAVEDAERLQRGLRRWEAEGGALGADAVPASWAAPAAGPPRAPAAAWRRFAAPRYLAPLAALAALVVAAVLLPPLLQHRESPQPAPGRPGPATLLTLSPLRGGPGQGSGPVLTLGDPGELLTISLEKRRGVPGPYRVTLLQDGRKVWSHEGLAADSEGPLVLAIEARLLPPGRAELVAESLVSPPQEVGRFPFEIERAPAASPDGR